MLALLALPAFVEPSLFIIAGLFACAAIVLGWRGMMLRSAAAPALVGLVLGIAELVLLFALSWYVSELERWEF